MYGLFNEEQRRKINLGGVSSATTHTSILDQAKARRNERLEQKRQHDSARFIQSWWRGLLAASQVRREIIGMFMVELQTLTGLRCLVLLGQNEEALEAWSSNALAYGLAIHPEERDSWIFLLRRVCVRLLASIASSPQARIAATHLNVAKQLLDLDPSILSYALSHGYYMHLAKAITAIPLQDKSSPSLPCIVRLITYPFTVLDASSPEYADALTQALCWILSIPLLPNRLPLPDLTALSSGLPLARLDLLTLDQLDFTSTTPETKVHLVANLLTFVSPRYPKLSGKSISAYLRLLVMLFNALPVHSLEPSAATAASNAWTQHDSDSEDDDDHMPMVSVVNNFETIQLPEIDARTLKRLQTLPSATHLSSVLKAAMSNASSRLPLAEFILALGLVWPTKREVVLSTVLQNAGGLVRELYRGYVRGASFGTGSSDIWAPILCLADLYAHALLTMGDDEFFGGTQKNPLSLDELKVFSKQLLNITFILYWKEDQNGLLPLTADVRCTWLGVREKLSKCLLAIHARDSRKQFLPADHWLVGAQLEMQSFVEAAVFDGDEAQGKLSKRQLAAMSPRWGILNNIPFAIPFEIRVSIFRQFVFNDMQKLGMSRYSALGRMNATRVTIRRTNVAQDGFDKLGDANLKAPVEISFIDQFGEPEAGIDGGGVFKEFFTSLCKEVFDTDRGLWLANKKNELYPNPHAYATEAHSLNWYRFIGRILGKAMYDGILVDVAFASFFLSKWLGKQNFLEDLASLDPDLYNGLIFLKHYDGNPEDLALNFTAAVDEFGVNKSVDLIPNGSNVAVTKENRLQYIYLVSHFRLSKQIKMQSEAFFEGLSEMIDSKWLRMFNQQEVQVLIGGANTPIDLEDLRQNTNYGGLYDDNEDTIRAFWNVVEGFDQEQRKALLRFVTSCSRPPLLGFNELTPHFAIRDAGGDEHRLPTSSTCVNLLKLPRYKTEAQLRTKLLQAIMSGAGFDLS